MTREFVIASACRSAVGSCGGSLKDVPTAQLGAVVMKEALQRAGLKGKQVDEVVFVCITGCQRAEHCPSGHNSCRHPAGSCTFIPLPN